MDIEFLFEIGSLRYVQCGWRQQLGVEVDIELYELAERWHKLPEKWIHLRKLVREEKLYTQVAKDFWDTLQGTDSSFWQMTSSLSSPTKIRSKTEESLSDMLGSWMRKRRNVTFESARVYFL